MIFNAYITADKAVIIAKRLKILYNSRELHIGCACRNKGKTEVVSVDVS